MSRTITTTTTVAGYSSRLTLETGSKGSSRARIEIQHVDPNGAPVRVPRKTPQTIRRPHIQGQPIPPRPVDTSLQTILAKTYTGTLAEIAAQASTDYTALEFPS